MLISLLSVVVVEAVAEVLALVEQADISKRRTMSSRQVLRTQLLLALAVQEQALRPKTAALPEAHQVLP